MVATLSPADVQQRIVDSAFEEVESRCSIYSLRLEILGEDDILTRIAWESWAEAQDYYLMQLLRSC
jgi:hypothetical protein